MWYNNHKPFTRAFCNIYFEGFEYYQFHSLYTSYSKCENLDIFASKNRFKERFFHLQKVILFSWWFYYFYWSKMWLFGFSLKLLTTVFLEYSKQLHYLQLNIDTIWIFLFRPCFDFYIDSQTLDFFPNEMGIIGVYVICRITSDSVQMPRYRIPISWFCLSSPFFLRIRFLALIINWGRHVRIQIEFLEMETMTRVQILDKAACVCTNVLGKDKDSSLLTPVMSK